MPSDVWHEAYSNAAISIDLIGGPQAMDRVDEQVGGVVHGATRSHEPSNLVHQVGGRVRPRRVRIGLQR